MNETENLKSKNREARDKRMGEMKKNSKEKTTVKAKKQEKYTENGRATAGNGEVHCLHSIINSIERPE